MNTVTVHTNADYAVIKKFFSIRRAQVFDGYFILKMPVKRASVGIANILKRQLIFDEINNALKEFERTEDFEGVKRILKGQLRQMSSLISIDPMSIERVLIDNKEINLSGYLNFCVQNEKFELRNFLVKKINEYQIEKQCSSFIGMLREYVETAGTIEDTVHILPSNDTEYKIYNTKLNDITDECIQFYRSELNGGSINYDDMLIHTLLNLLPARIVVHYAKDIVDKRIFSTIGKIFEVSTCDCCL